MIHLFLFYLFSCPAMEWGPRSEPYLYGEYVEYLSEDYVVQVASVSGSTHPTPGQNDANYIFTYCSEQAIPNDSIPSDTTGTDTTEVDTTVTDTSLVRAINRNTETMTNLSYLFSMIVGMVLMLMGYKDGKRG